jgi:hypothetical protein
VCASYLALIVIPVKFLPYYLAHIVIRYSAEKCFRTYKAMMVIFTLLYISVDGIKLLSLYDITI